MSRTRADMLYGAGLEALFPDDAPQALIPLRGAPRPKRGVAHDPERVARAVHGESELQEFDPRNLRATQKMVTRAGVQHYLSGGQFDKTGETFADQGSKGNEVPTIYDTDILSGHHRAVAALLEGRPLRGRSA